MKKIIFGLLISAATAHCAEWYASPSGSGDGSIGSPWGLSTALNSGSVQPGDTIYLRGGTYTGSFTSTIDGSDGIPVTVMSYTGEWAVIDRNSATGANTLTINGAYTTFRDFEVTNSNTTRTQDNSRPTGVDVFGPGTKLINLVIHDSGNGIGIWGDANIGTEITGCLIYNNGWFSTGTPHGTGHGIYSQNVSGVRLIRNNVIVNQFGYGIHAYTQSGNLNDMLFRWNVIANNGSHSPTQPLSRSDNFLVGGNVGASNIVAHTNYVYHPTGGNINARFGLVAENNADITAIGNYFIGGGADWVKFWTNVTFTGNVVYSSGGDLTITTNSGSSVYTWNNNTYYIGGVWIYQGSNLSFAQWKSATGYDASSTQTSPVSIGTPTWKFVHANPDTASKGYAVAWNWGDADNILVDISAIAEVGQSYAVRNAQNWPGGEIISGTYTGGNISLPMTNLVAAVPNGLSDPPSETGPRWNVFLVEASGESNPNKPIKPRRNGPGRFRGM